MSGLGCFHEESNTNACFDESPLSADINLELRSNVSSVCSSELSSESIAVANLRQQDSVADVQGQPSSFTVEDVFETVVLQDETGVIDIARTFENLIEGSETNLVDLKKLTGKVLDENKEAREQSQLEFVTILTAIKIVNEINVLLSSSLDETTFERAADLCLSMSGLFKYHFQLPQTHGNFGFKNFGVLLGLEKFSFIRPLLSVLFMAPKYDYPQQEKLKRVLILLLALHPLNKHMFDNMLSTFMKKDVFDMFTHIFDNDSTAFVAKEQEDMDGLFSLFSRFNDCLTLDQSTLSEDKGNDHLFNLILPDSSSSTYLKSVKALLEVDDIFSRLNLETNCFDLLTELTNRVTKDNLNREVLALYCFNRPDTLMKLNKLVDDPSFAGKKETSVQQKLAYYVLVKISESLITNFPLINVSDESMLRILIKLNNSNYKQALGITDRSYNYTVTQTTMKVLFEVVDQNFKLDLSTEKYLLQYLKVSLRNINYNLDSFESFLGLHSLLNDMGSRLSLHALLETVQFILSSGLNEEEFSHVGEHSQIPNFLEKIFGFEFIPPLGKSNFVFEDNLNFGDDSHKQLRDQTSELFSAMETSVGQRRSVCIKLLQDCLILCSVIKSKVYNHLREYNDELSIMKFSTEHQAGVKDDSINKFKQKTFTQLALFKSCHGLDFKIMNKSIDLNLSSTFSSLKVKDNYTRFGSSSRQTLLYNKVISNLIYQFQLDSLLSFLLIYKEFGLFSLFKFMKGVLLHDLSLIPIAAEVLSDLMGFENSSNKPKLQYVTSIISQSETLCNLARQFVELFDDGQSSSFRFLFNFMKNHPSPIKPSKIPKGSVELDLKKFADVLGYKNDEMFIWAT